MYIIMRRFFLRFFNVLASVIFFPFLFVSLFLAVLMIPFIIILDGFYFIFTGSFGLAEDYIINHFDKIAFHWYYVLRFFLDKYLY